MNTYKKVVYTFFLSLITTSAIIAQDAKQLVSEMIEAVGGKENFYNLKNVNYDYAYNNPEASMKLTNHETYVFHKELSYAKYTEHSILGANGSVIEGYDGTNAWVTFDGKLSKEEKPNGIARFLRKTNYYWFTMFFKLLDNGVNHAYEGTKTVNGKTYDIVKITFGKNVGDAQDTYVLYINKKTKLVDQFLFTVVGMGMQDPLLMVMEYETVDGIKIGSKRKYIASNWDGEVIGKQWTTTNWTNIKFNTDIDTSIFQQPSMK